MHSEDANRLEVPKSGPNPASDQKVDFSQNSESWVGASKEVSHSATLTWYQQELINKAVAIRLPGGQSALGAVTRWRQSRHSGRKWQLAGAMEIALKALFGLKLYLKLDYL